MPNQILFLPYSQNIWPHPKFLAGYATEERPCCLYLLNLHVPSQKQDPFLLFLQQPVGRQAPMNAKQSSRPKLILLSEWVLTSRSPLMLLCMGCKALALRCWTFPRTSPCCRSCNTQSVSEISGNLANWNFQVIFLWKEETLYTAQARNINF